MNGVRLTPAEYTASGGTTITLTSGATAGDIIDILTFASVGPTGAQVPKVIRAMHLTGQSLTSQQLLVRLRSHHLVDIQMVMTLMYL